MNDELKEAYKKLYLAARNLLELAEPCSDDEMIMHQDNYNDLAEAIKLVYQAEKVSE